jgi:hypothetical protein
MIVGFTTTRANSAYHSLSCVFEPRSWRGVHDTTLCDKVFSNLWFSPCTPVSPIDKTDRHDITEILLKVALSTINQPTIILYQYKEKPTKNQLKTFTNIYCMF